MSDFATMQQAAPSEMSGEGTEEVVDQTQEESTTTEGDGGVEQTQVESTTPETPEDIWKRLESVQLDPKLKEELKAGYLRQADYTKKTQEIAEQRRLAEEYQRVQPLVQKIMSDPTLRNAALGVQQPEKTEQNIPDDPAEYAKWVQEQVLERVNQMFTEREQQARQQAEQEKDFAQAEQVDPRLNTDPEFGQAVVGLVAQNQEYLAGRISAVEATKQAIAFFDNYTKKLVSTAKNDLVAKAKSQSMTGVVRSSPVSTGGSAPKTMAEAARMAEESFSK